MFRARQELGASQDILLSHYAMRAVTQYCLQLPKILGTVR